MMIKNYNSKNRVWIIFGGCLLFVLTFLSVSTPWAQAQTPTGLTLTLASLGYNDVNLGWRTTSAYYWFGLPTNWQPLPGSYLQLDLDYVTGGTEYTSARLAIQFNGSTIHNEIFTTSGGRQIRIPISADLIRSQETRYLNELLITLSINGDCEDNQWTTLTVRNSSLFYIDYTERPLSLDLSRYPQPIYQRQALTTTTTRFVLPATPGATDLQAALMVAAKLGELSDNNLIFESSSAVELPLPSLASEHLVVVGQPETNPLIGQLSLPVPLAERQLEVRSAMPMTVALGQPFDYTVWVKNTSSEAKTLRIEDVWPQSVTIEKYPDQCRQVADAVRCDLGRLDPGEEVSKVLQVRVDGMDWLGQALEHTASLLDDAGQVLNVDSLQAGVSLQEDPAQVVSDLPKPPHFFVYQNRGVSENDGIIQATYSPWSNQHMALVVTGNSDTAILKAGEALATQAQFPGMSGEYAFVQAIHPITVGVPLSQARDISLASLGYSDKTLNVASTSLQYTFHIPRGWALVSDATLDLHTSHSAALAVMSTTMQVYVNYIPVYSTLVTSENTENVWRTISIPARRMQPGVNRLTFELNGDFPQCINPRFANGLWLTVFSDSAIHIPHATISTTFDLSDFPRPFNELEDLSNILFVLPTSLRPAESAGVLRLVAALGAAGGGERIRPQVLLGTLPDEELGASAHIIAIGEPTRNPLIAALNDSLPQSFITGTSQIQQRVDDVIYRLPPNYSLGFIQELPSPWNRERAVLVVTGSTSEGVTWALEALTHEDLSDKLSGNLATLIRKEEMRVTDTRVRLDPYAEITRTRPTLVTTMTPVATVTPMPEPATPTPTPALTGTPTIGGIAPQATEPSESVEIKTRPIWLPPLLVVSLISVVVVVALALRRGRS
ncbi:MAG: cellulose biosynthesis cyclic di-GMP-binding regulatory protein BcsB [Anaerolineae bacterium]|nr:cellulose biosynthesis cyclic di-GMP-binding regulatory protein BcsB [Anaerolineae bacterium]